ncbi:hypothetical protein [Haloglomus salinum]|jgi:hypothetical protein|uniref:hypothetical protein n=1 Tax=Haloglomus salinum TaxID=2962673 RepID=UPI0020CA1AC8|nr:hypothetical protein [Haloglomus salinum]
MLRPPFPLPLPRLGRRGPPTVPVNDSLDEYADWLRGSRLRRLTVSKSVVDEVPDEFTRTRLAAVREDAVASYRDGRRRDSVHVVEYPDRWELHIDRFNPRYEPVGHVLVDAPEQTAEAVGEALGLDRMLGFGRRVGRVAGVARNGVGTASGEDVGDPGDSDPGEGDGTADEQGHGTTEEA